MPEIPLEWIFLLTLFLISVALTSSLAIRHLRVQGAKRRDLEARKRFSLILERRAEPTSAPRELGEALERVVKAIEGAAEVRRAVVKVRLDPSVELRVETPDLISLRMPSGEGRQATLHKSLGQTRIKSVKKVAKGYEIHLVIHGD